MTDKQLQNLYSAFVISSGVSIDTRTLKTKNIFFAIKGDDDGHKYVIKALDKGASFAVVSKLIKDLSSEYKEKVIKVSDTLDALQELAHYHRKLFRGPVIGIAGSNGKTTTKELLNRVLSQKFKTIATQGNFNNHIGVPLTLLSINLVKHDMAIVELGSNHHGELSRLCDIACPSHGYITSIGKEHLEGFGSLDGVIQEESLLYYYLVLNNGIIFHNTSNIELSNSVKIEHDVCFGGDTKMTIDQKSLKAFPKLSLAIREDKKKTPIKSSLLGSWNAMNILAAFAIGRYFDVPAPKCKKGIESYKPTNFRSEVRSWRSHTLVLDCYNANPTSMELVLKDFEKMKGNKVLVIGGMREMGRHEEEEHAELLKKIQKVGAKQVILIGRELAPFQDEITKKKWNWFIDAKTAKPFLKKLKLPSKAIILAKGSFGNKVWGAFGIEYKDH